MIKKVYNYFLKTKSSITNNKFLLKTQMKYLKNKKRKLSKDVLYTDKAFIIHKYKHIDKKHRRIKERLKNIIILKIKIFYDTKQFENIYKKI